MRTERFTRPSSSSSLGIQGLAGALEKALEKYQESLTLWRSAGDRVGEGAALCQIAAVYDSKVSLK